MRSVNSMVVRSLAVGLLLLPGLWCAAQPRQSFPDFTQIVEEKKPAVVKIIGIGKPSKPSQRIPYEDLPEIFRHFFDQPMPNPEPRETLGSGFLISADGYIVTNQHVIEDADTVIVRLLNRSEYEAEIVGADQRYDIALLKIDVQDQEYLSFSEEELKVGEWVIAIGSPFGFDYSVSAGVVSARGRSLPRNNENYVPFIQTDVAINPGNSGGPLLNLQGQVAGVNAQIYTQMGTYIGLSFSVPSSVALKVIAQLREKGHVVRGWLGVRLQEVTQDLADTFGLERPIGALVGESLEGGPAEEAGVKEGDIITHFNRQEIRVSGDLPHVVGLTEPDTRVPLRILRDGKPRILWVVVGSHEADLDQKSTTGESSARGLLGLVVEDLDDRTRERLEVEDGVLVRSVEAGSPAQQAGLQAGSVILSLNGVPVSSAREFRERLSAMEKGRAVHMHIRTRRGTTHYIALRIR